MFSKIGLGRFPFLLWSRHHQNLLEPTSVELWCYIQTAFFSVEFCSVNQVFLLSLGELLEIRLFMHSFLPCILHTYPKSRTVSSALLISVLLSHHVGVLSFFEEAIYFLVLSLSHGIWAKSDRKNWSDIVTIFTKCPAVFLC